MPDARKGSDNSRSAIKTPLIESDDNLIQLANLLNQPELKHLLTNAEHAIKIKSLIKTIINKHDPTNLENFCEQNPKLIDILMPMFNNREFNQAEINKLTQSFPETFNDDSIAYIIKEPTEGEELTNLQVSYVLNLLLRGKIANIPPKGLDEYIESLDPTIIISFSADIVISNPNPKKATTSKPMHFNPAQAAASKFMHSDLVQPTASKHIYGNFWEVLCNYYNNTKKFPTKLRLINRINFNNAHWTSTVTEIELDLEQQALKETINTILITETAEKLTAHDLNNIYLQHINHKEPNFTLPAKAITVKHYDSINPDANPNSTYHSKLIQSFEALKNANTKFQLTTNRCKMQGTNQCGDWNTLNGFMAGFLEQDPDQINTKKLGNLREISKECISLEQQIREQCSINSTQQQAIKNILAKIENSIIQPQSKKTLAQPHSSPTATSTQIDQKEQESEPKPLDSYTKSEDLTLLSTDPKPIDNHKSLLNDPDVTPTDNKPKNDPKSFTELKPKDNHKPLLNDPDVTPTDYKPPKDPKSLLKDPKLKQEHESILTNYKFDTSKLNAHFSKYAATLPGYAYIQNLQPITSNIFTAEPTKQQPLISNEQSSHYNSMKSSNPSTLITDPYQDPTWIGTVKYSGHITTKFPMEPTDLNAAVAKSTTILNPESTDHELAGTKTIAQVFNNTEQLKLKFPPKPDGNLESIQQNWIVSFLQNLPLEPGVEFTAVAEGFTPQDLQQILKEIDKINKDKNNSNKILIKFKCTSKDPEYTSIQENIKIHNHNITILKKSNADLSNLRPLKFTENLPIKSKPPTTNKQLPSRDKPMNPSSRTIPRRS